MKKLAMFLLVMILPAWAQPATAQGIFGGGLFAKKPKANPVQRVPELIVTLKSAQDDRQRAQAAAELGTMDTSTFGEVVPVLVDVLQNDARSGVRMEAASSLGSLRPVSQMAGQALERAAAQDDNLRVRWHAKGLLMKYRLAGYSASTPGNPRPGRTDEPPLLHEAGPSLQPLPFPESAPAHFPAPSRTVTRTPAPITLPALPPKNDAIVPEFRPSMPRPLPQGSSSFTTAVPQQAVRPAPAPLPVVEGPVLTPPPPPQRAPF